MALLFLGVAVVATGESGGMMLLHKSDFRANIMRIKV
jgi:hypothetical protein